METIARGAEFVAMWLFVWEVVIATLYRGVGWDRALSIIVGATAANVTAGWYGRRRLLRETPRDAAGD
jgi:hypothetical protein